jgi:hypothetical protein
VPNRPVQAGDRGLCSRVALTFGKGQTGWLFLAEGYCRI